jgi:hypothetical protein
VIRSRSCSDSAKKIGVDAARRTQRISADLDKALAMLFGRPSPKPFGPIDPNVPIVGAITGNSYGVGEGVGKGTREGTALYYNARERRHRSPYSSRRYDHLWHRLGQQLPWVAAQGVSTHWLRHTNPDLGRAPLRLRRRPRLRRPHRLHRACLPPSTKWPPR